MAKTQINSASKKISTKVDPQDFIIIKGARVNNLKNISLNIPRNQLITITGLSGSGKSSLAFDTLYAEGQRRYVESLSSYARQFLGRLDKPEVDKIEGISPAIAIEQKVVTRNPRSTVGTSTEIYDYLKLLYARIGATISPISGKPVKRHTVSHVVDYINAFSKDTLIILYAPISAGEEKSLIGQLKTLVQQGYSRVKLKDELLKINDVLDDKAYSKSAATDIQVVIDRVVVDKGDLENQGRISDSVQTAFYEGEGQVNVQVLDEKGKEQELKSFSNRFELDGMEFEKPSVHFFSFNNPYGACKSCEGFGSIVGIDEDLVIPNKGLSVYEDAIVCWRGEKMGKWKEKLLMSAAEFDFPIHRPFFELTDSEKKVLWTGNEYFKGLNAFFKYVEKKSYKIQYRVMLSRFRGKTRCPECDGTRLRKDASYVLVGGKSIQEVVLMPATTALKFFAKIKLNKHDATIASRLLTEVLARLQVLCDVGLGYLTINRLSNTLSGGESQRINLATSLGSTLVGSMYILDEPSIGLHPRDTQMLIGVLQKLKDLGNSVIIVEHDEEIMKQADQIIDLGPFAGSEGGEVIFQGNFKTATKNGSLTVKYLRGELEIAVPAKRRMWSKHVEISKASENNLKRIDVKIPLGVMTVVTGVSGSGKSSLIRNILYPGLTKILGGYGQKTGYHEKIGGDIEKITQVEFVDQNPIGKSSRSNPVTYVKAYDEIRNLYSDQALAKQMGYKPSFFSFNVAGGRCDECEGEGKISIEMQFMADVQLVCDSCKGKRFKKEILDVTYEGKSISDILNLTVDEAMEFFEKREGTIESSLLRKLKPLLDVGMGYVKLGQPSSTLSGGEAQRVKLATYLGKRKTEANASDHTLFIFDEPTTGLHFHDISKLLDAFNALIDRGHSIVIIEHNMEIIKNADWIIDLGPEGGEKGGYVLFAGTPENLVKVKESYTGKYLKEKL